ncbi:MAG: hypothetical protein FWD60_11645 [Candidatus Azobacteroides sp.]|nr:hypothetical protein [Candidatus Azobacteroides sp.]
MDNEWKTGISTVYWAKYKTDNQKKYEPELAKLCLGAETADTVSWLDELFMGKGIQVEDDNPITLLIKGPPGSGKTTFALELCYRLSKNKAITSTYVSLESKSKQIVENATKFGWKKDFMQIINADSKSKTIYTNICGAESFSSKDTVRAAANVAKDVFMTSGGVFSLPLVSLFSTISNFCNLKFHRRRNAIELPTSQVLVIDSLNIFPEEKRGEAFQELLNIAKNSHEMQKIKLIILMLDAKSNTDANPFWEYVCDTVIDLNHYVNNDYFIRTIEIIKARFQQQILGKHQYKIYKSNNEENPKENIDILSRMHPVRVEGGIFIFPSIHFYLSKYGKFTQNGELKYDATYPDKFAEFLSLQSNSQEGGFPKGRCTALIGCRGGHKSHLAYLHVLAKLTGNFKGGAQSDSKRNAALIISLRDDEKMLTSTLNGILDNEFPTGKWKSEDLIKDGSLEILYYPPGYISPEEFIHRIFVSIHKLKSTDKNVTVLFNSLDQIAARFPLCAKLDIFIPSIIQILIGEEITSIFIAVDEKDQPVEQYGLLPMADLILSFHQHQLTNKQYDDILRTIGKSTENNKKDETQKRDEIILTVERFAGGKKAGSKGLLELGNKLISDKNIINFIELPPTVYLEKNHLKK